MEILFLGTGTSHGVPVLDCITTDYAYCTRGVCRLAETNPKHNRTRSSILISDENKNILIDCGPDFRAQALREKIRRIDAVLFTHRHSDHIDGIPDIRSYSTIVKSRTEYLPKSLPIYGSDETISAISQTFSYIFDPNTFIGGGIPTLERNIVDSPFKVFDLKFIPLLVEHGNCRGCFGYLFKKVAYISDVKRIYPETLKKLYGLDLLIIDLLRYERPHTTHLIYPELLDIINELRPKKVLCTHLCHAVHYEEDEKVIDPRIKFAFDGQKVIL